jgi:hypothetical protein
MHVLAYSDTIAFRVKFSRDLPGELGPAMLREDLVKWWKALPGIAERHRTESAPYVTKGRYLGFRRGHETKYHGPIVAWHDVPSPRALARLYARAHGACTWIRADGDCFAVWYAGDGARFVCRSGKRVA